VPAVTAAELFDLAVGFALLAAAVVASGHAVLTKIDVRSAIGWVSVIWLVPGVGAALYWLLGINRIRRRAYGMGRSRGRGAASAEPRGDLTSPLAPTAPHLDAVARLVGAVSGAPLTHGNAVTVYDDAVAAIEAMLAAIAGAERSVALASYIFEGAGIGERFVHALADAHRRGVAVRVLIDGVGRRYASPAVGALLAPHGVPVAEFLPTRFPLHLKYANLRNHRKILVVDGRMGFTGGMNIRNGYVCARDHADAVRDVQVAVEGPVVATMLDAFRGDWTFCTGERLQGAAWETAETRAGPASARAIASGPDLRTEPIRATVLGALAHAARRVRIATPYFLPDTEARRMLAITALRGVTVEILIPARTNLRLVQWASRARIVELLQAGCRIFESPAPFDHRKTMTVDGAWSLVGSANWDERSFRLNFELDIEIYDCEAAIRLDRLFDETLATARPLSAAAIARRPLPIRLRDGAAWLLSPYL
jgi:cardiolipin synthase A/B